MLDEHEVAINYYLSNVAEVSIIKSSVFKWTLEALIKAQGHLHGTMTDGAVMSLVVHCSIARRAEARVAARNTCNASIAWCCQTNFTAVFNCRRRSRCSRSVSATVQLSSSTVPCRDVSVAAYCLHWHCSADYGMCYLFIW